MLDPLSPVWFEESSWQDDDYAVCADNVGFDLMQFTGLLDKNGKDIYEGDILSFNSRPPVGSVSFHSGSYWVADAVLGRASVQGEVIGNIYENPELLKTNPENV